MKKFFTFFSIFLLAIIVFLSSWMILHGSINFHTDIARDFLLIEDIVFNKNLTLLGPRAGGIPGVFHGPLWLYIHIPAFLFGGGNPVIVGWFWVTLFILSIGFVYYVTKRLFDEKVAIFAALIYAVSTASSIHALFNPFGAVMFFPLFFYFFYSFITTKKLKHLLISLFILGVIIQFQMAFGVPLLVLILPIILYISIKQKDIKPILSMIILAVPLASFFLFEVKNNFLQIRAVLEYVGNSEIVGKQDLPLLEVLSKRMTMLWKDGLGLISQTNIYVSLLFILGLIYTLIYSHKKPNSKDFRIFLLFVYLCVGYWIITLPYKGVMWGYYYWPFAGVVAIFFAALYKYIPKILFFLVFIYTFLLNFIPLYNGSIKRGTDYTKDSSTWAFYKNVSDMVYRDAPYEFGYYIYTTDQYGYSTRYAMNYGQRLYKDKVSAPYAKKEMTYLLIDDPEDHPFTNNKSWRQYDVKIAGNPIVVSRLNKTYKIEKYKLSQEAQKIESNPNLIHTLIFR